MKETEVHSRLMYVFQRIRKVNIMSGAKVSRMEFFALQVIGSYPHKTGPSGIYVSKLAEQLKIASSQTSRMLKGLEERGLISRSIDDRDRRNTCVFLTEKGKEICRETQEYMKNYMARVLQAMGEERVEELISLCSELAGVMEQEAEKNKNQEE